MFNWIIWVVMLSSIKEKCSFCSSFVFPKNQNSFFSFYINGNDRQGDRWGYGLGLECFYTS